MSDASVVGRPREDSRCHSVVFAPLNSGRCQVDCLVCFAGPRTMSLHNRVRLFSSRGRSNRRHACGLVSPSCHLRGADGKFRGGCRHNIASCRKQLLGLDHALMSPFHSGTSSASRKCTAYPSRPDAACMPRGPMRFLGEQEVHSVVLIHNVGGRLVRA